jgi:hypothetical protein
MLRWLPVLLLLAPSLWAQSRPPDSKLFGMTFDHYDGAVGAAVLRPTLRFTNFRGPLGADFSVTFFPDGFSLRPPLVTTELAAGLVNRVRLGPVSVLLKGGAAAIVSAGLGNERLLHVIPGVHYGVGLLLPLEARARIRADLTQHLFRSEGRSVRFWSIGLGFVVSREARPD